MAKRKAGTTKAKQATDGQNGGIVSLTKELFQAAITLRGSVEPADYKDDRKHKQGLRSRG